VTYARVLLLFVVPPLVIAALLARPFFAARHLAFVAGLSAVVLVWTSPWDNAAVAMGLWSFDLGRTSGLVIGRLPIEEYAFFLLQTWLGVAAAVWWMRR